MFSGKSSYLLSTIRKYKEIDVPVYIITSSFDKRYTSDTKIINHNQDSCIADIALEDLLDIIVDETFNKAKVIIIEEAQFFKGLVDFVYFAVDLHKKHLIVAGLDGDANRKPFGEVLQLIPLADSIIKLKAFCKKCNSNGIIKDALFTSKKVNDASIIDVGGSDKYEALCRIHYNESN